MRRVSTALVTPILLATVMYLLATPFTALADLSFVSLSDCKMADGSPFPSAYLSTCQQHLNQAKTAESNALNLISAFTNCKSPRAGSNIYCIRLSLASKLINESVDSLINKDFPTQNGDFTDAARRDFLNMANAYGVIFGNDGYAATGILGGSLMNALDGLPETPTADAVVARTDFSLQHATYVNTINKSCGAAWSAINAASGSPNYDRFRAAKRALLYCQIDTQNLTPSLLAALTKLDVQANGGSGSAGGTVGQGAIANGQILSGTPLSLPLPLGNISLPGLIARVIRQVLSIVGALALAFFVWGGLRWMLARGAPEEVAKAKKIIVAAVSGLVAIFASYAILKLILDAISK